MATERIFYRELPNLNVALPPDSNDPSPRDFVWSRLPLEAKIDTWAFEWFEDVMNSARKKALIARIRRLKQMSRQLDTKISEAQFLAANISGRPQHQIGGEIYFAFHKSGNITSYGHQDGDPNVQDRIAPIFDTLRLAVQKLMSEEISFDEWLLGRIEDRWSFNFPAMLPVGVRRGNRGARYHVVLPALITDSCSHRGFTNREDGCREIAKRLRAVWKILFKVYSDAGVKPTKRQFVSLWSKSAAALTARLMQIDKRQRAGHKNTDRQ